MHSQTKEIFASLCINTICFFASLSPVWLRQCPGDVSTATFFTKKLCTNPSGILNASGHPVDPKQPIALLKGPSAVAILTARAMRT